MTYRESGPRFNVSNSKKTEEEGYFTNEPHVTQRIKVSYPRPHFIFRKDDGLTHVCVTAGCLCDLSR